MIYAEAAYFNGNHCQHMAAREEHFRLTRLTAEAGRLARRQARQAMPTR